MVNLFFFFAPELLGLPLKEALDEAIKSGHVLTKKEKDYAKKRSNMARGLNKLINCEGCYRVALLDFSCEQKSVEGHENGCCNCCSTVSTTTQISVDAKLWEPGNPIVQIKHAPKERQTVMTKRLVKWGQDAFRQLHSNTPYPYRLTLFSYQ